MANQNKDRSSRNDTKRQQSQQINPGREQSGERKNRQQQQQANPGRQQQS